MLELNQPRTAYETVEFPVLLIAVFGADIGGRTLALRVGNPRSVLSAYPRGGDTGNRTPKTSLAKAAVPVTYISPEEDRGVEPLTLPTLTGSNRVASQPSSIFQMVAAPGRLMKTTRLQVGPHFGAQ